MEYLLTTFGLTETKNHPNTTLSELHLSDGAIDILKSGKLNNRLICEILCHEHFRRLLVDSEIYVDRISEMHTGELTAIMGSRASQGLGENRRCKQFRRSDFGNCGRG